MTLLEPRDQFPAMTADVAGGDGVDLIRYVREHVPAGDAA
jgi:hypothetical protein